MSGFSTFGIRALMGTMLLGCLTFSSCKLDKNKGPHAEILPADGSTNIPVNAAIRIRYPVELGLTLSDMKPDLFSIQECKKNKFDYLNPRKETTTTPDSTTEDSTSTSTATDGSKKKNETKNPSDPQTSSETSYVGNPLKLYLRTVEDKTTGVFNYLVINPGDNNSPLKNNTTYCVQAKKIKNSKGETINSSEISFTTEDSVNFSFDSKIDSEFFAGNGLKASGKNVQEKIDPADYILIYFGNNSVRPNFLKNKIKLCLLKEPSDTSATTNNCGDDFNGKVVGADIMMIEGLKDDQDGIISSNYNLYGITPNGGMKEGQKYKIVLNLDVGTNGEESNNGTREVEFDVLANDQPLNWLHAYKEEIKNATGQLIYSKTQRFFYIGQSSTSATSSSENITKDN